MRADKIVELGIISEKNDPRVRETGLAVLSYPIFDFGRFDYPDFKGLQDDSMVCWNESLLEFPFNECCFIHQYDYMDQAAKVFTENRSMYCINRPMSGGPVYIAEWRSFNIDGRGSFGVAPQLTLVVHPNPDRLKSWTCEWYPTPWTTPDIVKRFGEYFTDGNKVSEFIDPVMAMAMYLNTTGVISDRKPAPVALNKSRLKKGKLPIPECYTVRIDPRVLGVGGGSGDGHHASPRPHYRRGHIRRLDEGRTTWVKACIVAGSAQDAKVPVYEVRK